MKKHIIGIDLGTSNTLIWINNSDAIVFNEPTVLVWNKKSDKIVEIGYLAHKLIGKIPNELELVYPVVGGAVGNIEAAASYIRQAFVNLKQIRILRNSTIIFSAPSDLTDVEKQALRDVAKTIGAGRVFIEDAAKVSAIGSGIDVFSTRGNMIVDIGGSRTNIAAITMGKIVISKTTNYAGSAADEAIIRFLRTIHHLVVGQKTAEYIKMKIGTLLETPDNNLLEVSGKDAVSGLPHSIIVSTVEIQEVITKIYNEIANIIIDTLEVIPPEISSDIIHTGITISGGGCLLNGTREYFQKQLSVPVHISPYPLESAIQGIKSSADRIVNQDNNN